MVDGIYPCWSVFAKTYQYPTYPPEILYAITQEHVRKDVERAFGVFVAHFGVLERKLRGWYINDIKVVIDCCIVIHNMTAEARRDGYFLTDLMEVPVEEVEEGTDQDLIFMEEGNQVG